MRSIHHVLTFSRLPLSIAAVFLYDPAHPTQFAGFLLVLAYVACSDYFDGKIARRLNRQSELGYIVDGLADRGFHIALILVFHLRGYTPTVLVWLLIFRDVAIYALRLAHIGWYHRGKSLRLFSIIHGYGLRMWAMALIGIDTLRAYTSINLQGPSAQLVLNVFIALILGISYIGLSRLAVGVFSDPEKSKEACDRWSKP